MPFKGRCLCGAVRYGSSGAAVFMGNRYCADCRRESGSGHITAVAVPDPTLTGTGSTRDFTKPADSGQTIRNTFCPVCATTLFSHPSSLPGLALLRAGTLDDDAAVGVDLWRAEDPADNTADAARENARRAGVAERVRVETGDARALPFADATFDVVPSHWVVHNLPDAADRSHSLDETLRVPRPGGTLVLADIAHHAICRERLAARGHVDLRVDRGGLKSMIVGLLSAGSFRPEAVVGRRA